MSKEIDCPSASGKLRARVESLPFSAIPGQSRLFLDYLSDPVALSHFYPGAVRSHVDVAGRIPEVLKCHNANRETLCNVLLLQNKAFGASEPAIDNINLLRRSGTVAVLTGQQAGLFSGPLYTIYKALSAVRMAACLRQRGHDAVPVFWAATEDHDFDEVSRASIAGSDGRIIETRYIPAGYTENLPVGKVIVDRGISAAIDGLFLNLPRTEFTENARQWVQAAYTPGLSFGTAFASLIARIFAPFGLIVVDPLDAGLKRLAAPIYSQAVSASQSIVHAVRKRGSEITAAGYRTQVEVGDSYFPLFWHTDDGRRTALKVVEGRLYNASTKVSFSLTDLESAAAGEPERFSPGVMLRPVVQDYLFPTVCYFGGAAEIAYFAQNSEVYRVLNRPVTPILHRQSFTIVEARLGRALGRLGLVFTDLFRDFASLRAQVVSSVIDPESASLFTETERNVNRELDRLGDSLSTFDQPLAAAFAKRRKKIIYHLDATRRSFERERISKDSTAGRRLRSATANLLPNGSLQERSLNFFQYLDRYGEFFVEWLYRAVDLDDKEHRIIYL